MDNEIMVRLTSKFVDVFGGEAVHKVFSPGRVNIIGEHIDYNGGNVMPASISLGTYVLFAPRADRQVRLYSENFADLGILSYTLDTPIMKQNVWTDFAMGMIATFNAAGYTINQGFDAYVFGTIPAASGLSSSASLEMAFGVYLNYVEKLDLDIIEVIKLAQVSERTFVGVNVGIMDMFAIGAGKKNKAILLDTNALAYTYIPMEWEDYSLLIMNTKKARALTDSKYNERRSECETALKALQKVYEVEQLCELTVADLPKIASILQNDVLYRRVKHVITEQDRTRIAQEAMAQNDLSKLGEALNASHFSLRDDYEVTGKELDSITELFRNTEGVLGARMTGAGFGGCAIAIVADSKVDEIIAKCSAAYTEETGLIAEFYPVAFSDGTMVV